MYVTGWDSVKSQRCIRSEQVQAMTDAAVEMSPEIEVDIKELQTAVKIIQFVEVV